MHRLAIIALLVVACASPAPSTSRTAPQVAATGAPSAPLPQTEAAPAPAEQASDAQPAPVEAPVAEVPAREIAEGMRGAVSSAERHASRVGLDVLQKGGHAVDAAVAIALALAVTEPWAGNIGGGGFMIVRTSAGESVAIDFREVAPRAATETMYLDGQGNVTRDSLVGPLAAGIPGTVAGLELAHKRFGRLQWKELVEPAVRLARAGHTLDEEHAKTMEEAAKDMRDAGFADSARIYEGPEGKPLAAGEVWRQPELAATLQDIAEQGPRTFYEGALAARIAAAMATLSGIWTAEDLRSYRAIERKPIAFDYRGHQVITMPPPSAGGIVMRQILAASEQLGIYRQKYRSADAFHLYVEAARRANADRNHWVGDPDFVRVPTDELIATKYIRARMKGIDRKRATPSAEITSGAPIAEHEETTHFSVVDGEGNAVSVTYTLNGSFGANVVLPGTGILLNNEMDDFAAKPGTANLYGLVQGKRNAIAAGKRMLSSMTPTIVTKGKQLRAVLGSPGGPTIPNTVTEILMALVDHKQPLEAAVRARRVHHQWLPDRVTLEEGIEEAIEQGLAARGHAIAKRERIGHASCIERDPKSGKLRAVADFTRGGGSAEAY